jgi:hypothetical protein
VLRTMPRLILSLFVLLPIAFAATPQTFLLLNSQPGDYVGDGIQQTFTPSDGTFSFTAINNGAVQMIFHNADYSQDWVAQFEAPTGLTLRMGIYEYTQGIHTKMPGLAVGGDGRGCAGTGRFLVSDIAIDSSGVLQRLAVDFEQHCDGAIPALYGSVRYNSTVTAVPRLSIANANVLKGDAGTNGGNAIVSLSMPSAQIVSVQLATADGTAIQGQDYVSTSETVQFPPGTTSQNITIPIIGNTISRGNRTFSTTLNAPSGAPLAVHVGEVKIWDPNGNVTALALSSQPGDFVGGGGIYLFTLADASFSALVNYDNGVSIALQNIDPWDLDFAAANNATLTVGTYNNAQAYQALPDGAPGLSISGEFRGCNTVTGNFVVNHLTYGTTNTVASFSADAEQHCEGATPALFASIRINAPMRQISVSDAVIDTNTSTAVFTVTLHPSSATPVSVGFATADGTALAGSDYVSTNKTVNFPARATSVTVSVPLLVNPDGGKIFYGQLSSPAGAPLWINRGVATF